MQSQVSPPAPAIGVKGFISAAGWQLGRSERQEHDWDHANDP